MAVESEELTELGDEFALVAQTAAEAGAAGADVVATEPAALAAALNQLLTTTPEGQQ